MELRHLRYFQAVAEDLNYSKAARRLRVAQPALSRAVKDLESFLGTAVLERSRHHVRLTPAGAVLLHETGLLLERLQEGLQRVQRTSTGEEGELRLGYVGPPTQAFLGQILSEYRHRYPRVTLHLEERTPERIWEMVAKGRLSTAITRPVIGHEAFGLATAPIRDESLGVVVRADHPFSRRRSVPWTALHSESLIVLARREGMGLHDTTLAACRRAGVVPKLAHTPSLIGTVLLYVEAGSGVAIVTQGILPNASPLHFIPLTPQSTVPLVLVWQIRDDPPPVQRFRELLSEWKKSARLKAPLPDRPPPPHGS